MPPVLEEDEDLSNSKSISVDRKKSTTLSRHNSDTGRVSLNDDSGGDRFLSAFDTSMTGFAKDASVTRSLGLGMQNQHLAAAREDDVFTLDDKNQLQR